MQVLYASSELKARCGVPPELDVYDDEAIAQMQLLVSLDAMAAALRGSPYGAQHNAGLQTPAARCVPASYAPHAALAAC